MKLKSLASLAFALFSLIVFPKVGNANDYRIFCNASNAKFNAEEVLSVKQINTTTVEILLSNKACLTIDFYGENIFRLFQDQDGGFIRNPEAKPAAEILVQNPRKPIIKLSIKDDGNYIEINTLKISVQINKKTTLLRVTNLEMNSIVLEQAAPILLKDNVANISFKENADEYFYGGGVQNGRFSHKGKAISIENQNSWTDGGVASPTPFYWSTKGYGLMWYTFSKGKYDFGAKEKGTVSIQHETNYLDLFVMVNIGAKALLNDFYQLTGNPILLPKFGFYEGHLNAYNRDFWKEDDKGILFEDGKRYKESQKDNGGMRESLNGEKNNYQFSARAVIDRYESHDMPFGWILPNDGYGAGYGRTESLEGNVKNLKDLGDYARKKGVEIGLWTQSDLHPKEGISPLLQRDIIREVRDAGVRVLKTDVAWVGAGYSFGLNGVADVAATMPYYGNNDRPFIISLDGWAGTQRYASIWSGDQTGGAWEYIRFHIPTYIGSGLSGQPNITSDMDGIFGGKNSAVNTRDFQWKTFTPMQLNMDGWGSNEKYPHAFGEPITSINRNYLKLKSELLPYSYSIAKEAVDGLPIVRAMFLGYPGSYANGISTQYQFMYGPNFLVAPIYQETKVDKDGNDIRNGIYLPKGIWIDYFSGNQYQGDRIINNFDSPLWKVPVFVRAGAIIPLTAANNNVKQIENNARIYEIYPHAKSSFTEYDDDGTTEAYKLGRGVITLIESNVEQDKAIINVQATKGEFDGFVPQKTTEFRINVTAEPKRVSAKVGNQKVKLSQVLSKEEFVKQNNVFFYDEKPNFNRFSTKGSPFEKIAITKNPQVLVKVAATDVTKNSVELTIDGFKSDLVDQQLNLTGKLNEAHNFKLNKDDNGAFSFKPRWDKVANADYYEIKFSDMLYSTITDTTLLFENLSPETNYSLQLRAVNKDGVSDWTALKITTEANPLQFAIKGIGAKTSAENQGGEGIIKLFDFDESSMWHTKWGVKSDPFEMIIDLKGENTLDRLAYLPRQGGGNGTLLKGKVFYSNNKENWTLTNEFDWKNNGTEKVVEFKSNPIARYLKLDIEKGAGGFGSGREMYVFRVAGSEASIAGDINNDKIIDRNDLTSYTNYTGLRKGDADFEGYISKGDINKNGVIDAFDISNVATQLDGGVRESAKTGLAGTLVLSTPKSTFEKDQVVEVTVKGIALKDVNALSFSLPYNAADYEYLGSNADGIKSMENLTYDRLHSDGTKVLYPTFVNIGNKEVLSGEGVLFVLRLRAKRKLIFNLKMVNGILVDKALGSKKL
ncbi:discoidin domain-containing protein [Pedobacter sp. MC2016-05]|uniref:TIM-barrel domain-containing protein n=1 Tax=Pedobacter sp. MC2016-05 TaxID=2994474 RepID=UPI0022477BD1|nr:TIM-barrel domain-containing protein [Pedobacter sp. MC2016-05]MCX2473411.1 discoidin domain-containing protein [Pedobacter sp. MC2016-05]